MLQNDIFGKTNDHAFCVAGCDAMHKPLGEIEPNTLLALMGAGLKSPPLAEELLETDDGWGREFISFRVVTLDRLPKLSGNRPYTQSSSMK